MDILVKINGIEHFIEDVELYDVQYGKFEGGIPGIVIDIGDVEYVKKLTPSKTEVPVEDTESVPKPDVKVTASQNKKDEKAVDVSVEPSSPSAKGLIVNAIPKEINLADYIAVDDLLELRKTKGIRMVVGSAAIDLLQGVNINAETEVITTKYYPVLEPVELDKAIQELLNSEVLKQGAKKSIAVTRPPTILVTPSGKFRVRESIVARLPKEAINDVSDANVADDSNEESDFSEENEYKNEIQSTDSQQSNSTEE